MAQYNLIFQGKIIDGYSLNEVKANIARLFNADAAKTATLFSGKAIVIKKNLDSQSAKKYLSVFKKAGARIKAVKIAPTNAEAAAEKNANNANSNAVTSPSGGLSAGLASLVSYSQPKAAPANTEQKQQGLQLAPPGTSLQNTDQLHDNSTAQLPDTSHLTMTEAQSGSLAEFTSQVTAIELPDIDNLSLSEANTGSLEEFAVKAEPAELPDISELDIAELDNTPLSAGQLNPEPIEIPDTSQLSMSETGEGIFASSKKQKPAVEIPDISHIEITAIGEETETQKTENSGKAVFQIN